MFVPPPRCLRCGAASRDPLCPACVDYLVAYQPLWLNPALLPGPSLLDLMGSPEAAILDYDRRRIEWRTPEREPTDREAVRLVGLLGLDAKADPIMSVGDADMLHALLGRARRGLLLDSTATSALAALYRYLSTREWMPPHLASEYALRARSLEPPSEAPLTAEEAPVETGMPETRAETIDSIPRPAPPADETAAEEPPESAPEAPPEPAAESESRAEELLESLLEEEGPPHSPEPDESPAAPPEPPATSSVEGAEGETPGATPAETPPREAPDTFDEERREIESWVRARSDDLEAKERALVERERLLESKEQEVEEHERDVTARLVTLEKDEARQEVLRFLGTVPGMTEEAARVIATAFPDMASLQGANGKALAQCKGVTEPLARAIRYELAPGEVEDEHHTILLREEAQGFMEEGNYQSALECYDRMLQERTEDTLLWFDKAELLVLLDRSEEALRCYTRVLDLDRGNRQAWLERANLLFGMGRLSDAFESLREGLRIDPSKTGDIILKAEQLRRDGRANDAAVLLQAVLDVDPENERATLALGDTLLDLGDVDAAEGLFTRVLGADAHNPSILFRKGQLLNRKGRWGAAIQYYNRAIALQWDYVDPWLAKGQVLLSHDLAEESLECFDQVLSLQPHSAEAWAGKALAHLALGESSAAQEALDRTEQLDPNHPAVRAARERGARERTVDAGDSPSPLGSKTRGKAPEGPQPETATEPPEDDLESFLGSADEDVEDAAVLLQLADLALEGGDAQMALLRYNEAIGRQPRSAEAWAGKGIALQHLQRYDEAMEAYDRALSLAPDHERAKRWRETCLRHLAEGGSE